MQPPLGEKSARRRELTGAFFHPPPLCPSDGRFFKIYGAQRVSALLSFHPVNASRLQSLIKPGNFFKTRANFPCSQPLANFFPPLALILLPLRQGGSGGAHTILILLHILSGEMINYFPWRIKRV